jgi:hypothetical protein
MHHILELLQSQGLNVELLVQILAHIPLHLQLISNSWNNTSGLVQIGIVTNNV